MCRYMAMVEFLGENGQKKQKENRKTCDNADLRCYTYPINSEQHPPRLSMDAHPGGLLIPGGLGAIH